MSDHHRDRSRLDDAFLDGAERAFKHDVFVSYAHLDNADGAVDAFVAQLREVLWHELPHWEPEVWLDSVSLDQTALRDDESLAARLRAGFSGSAVTVPVISSHYALRRWCREEMGTFLAEAQLDRCGCRRLFPAFLPLSTDPSLEAGTEWARYIMQVPLNARYVWLEPNRRDALEQWEFTIDQCGYWDRLYGWMADLAREVRKVNYVFKNWETLLGPGTVDDRQPHAD
jgi:hypothetical protein